MTEWKWKQPQTQAELLARLADARDLAVPERERENLCACAITEINRLIANTTDKTSAAIPVQEIVTRHLQMHGFDGLTDGDDCGCFLRDLMPCECPERTCVPGYAGKNEDGEPIIQTEKVPKEEA